jgi:peptidyl-prolyl cis-trans isomerase C
MFLKYKFIYAVILSLCVLISAGCDKMSAAVESFKGNDSKTDVQKAPAKTKMAATSQSAQKANGQVLAKIGNWTITVDEFNDRLDALKEIVPEYDTNDPASRQLVLEELVNQQLLVLGAEQTGLANDKDIRAAVEEFRRTLIVREVARQLTENINVTDQEARKFYDENIDVMIGPAEWRVREIMVPTMEEANQILSQILGGADFGQLAKLHSKSPSAGNGGDLGFITEEPFAQMGNALLSLEPGGVSGVFKGPDGYYIVKLEEKREGKTIAFDEIKADIIDSQMLMMQQQAILDHLDRLRAKTTVEINEQLLSN